MHLLRHGRLIHRKLLVVLAATLLWWCADFALEFSFPTYLSSVGKSYFQIGLFFAIAAASGLLIDVPMGALSDRFSRRRLMMAGLVLQALFGCLVFGLSGDVFLGVCFFLWGLAFQLWRVPRDALFASQTDRFDRGEEYGLDIEVKYAGQSAGTIIGGVALTYLGFSGIIGFYGFLTVLGVLVLFLFLEEADRGRISSAYKSLTGASSLYPSLRGLGGFWLMLLYLALLMTAWEQMLLAFQPLFYGPKGLGISAELGGLLLACFSLPGIFLAYPAGRLADRFGRKNFLSLGLLVMGSSLVLFSYSVFIAQNFLFALLTSVGWVMCMPSLYGLMMDVSAGQKRGAVVGTFNLFMDFGFIAGPLVGGAVAQLWGLKAMFLSLGCVLMLSSLAFSLHRGAK